MNPRQDFQEPVAALCERALGPQRAGHAIFRHAFVPGILAILAVSWSYREQSTRVLRAWSIPIDFTSMALLVSILFVWFAEQAYPEKEEWNYQLLSDGAHGWNRLGRDVLYLFGIAQVSALLLKATAPLLKSTIAVLGLDLARALWPSASPFLVRVILAFLVVEFFSYWLHRACHRFQFLWQFHSTHHVVTELNGLKALRTHPIENVFFYIVRSAPLMLVGAGLDEVLAVAYFGSVLSVLAHANINVSEGYLGLLVNFPRYHAIHHSSNVVENKNNFGCHTILWDRIFGTFRRSLQQAPEIGVQGIGPRSLWQELAWPFYRSITY